MNEHMKLQYLGSKNGSNENHMQICFFLVGTLGPTEVGWKQHVNACPWGCDCGPIAELEPSKGLCILGWIRATRVCGMAKSKGLKWFDRACCHDTVWNQNSWPRIAVTVYHDFMYGTSLPRNIGWELRLQNEKWSEARTISCIYVRLQSKNSITA